MLLSRSWYLVLSVALAGALFLLYLATAMTNRRAVHTGNQLLTAASQTVRWYLTDDSRQRATALVRLALDESVRDGLSKASAAGELKAVDSGLRDKVKRSLATFREQSAANGMAFDAAWAIDVHGRVLASENFERDTDSPHFEMGGYSLVADAIHGWIRDDAWVFDGHIYRVVARPVETNVGGTPVGCIVAAKKVDAGFAQKISDRTGAAVAFYAGGSRVAIGAPSSFSKASLEVHAADIAKAEKDENYIEKGRTTPMALRESAGFDVQVIYTRMPGEAWDLGAGYVVGHRQAKIASPLDFPYLANEDEKNAVPVGLMVVVALFAAIVGVILSIFEHTLPLRRFRDAVAELAKKSSSTDALKPSTFRGTFKKIAADMNHSLDNVAAAAGVERGPADLESVLGPLPSQPQMSAFTVPDSNAGATPPPRRSLPKAPDAPRSAGSARAVPKPTGTPSPDEYPSEEIAQDSTSMATIAMRAPAIEEPQPAVPQPAVPQPAVPQPAVPQPAVPQPAVPQPAVPQPAVPQALADPLTEDDQPTRIAPRPIVPQTQAVAPAQPSDPEDEETEWRKVYSDFVAMKRRFGEPTEKLTYQKFRGTLQRNKDALMARHHCAQVRFRVYEKDGRAALKASPVK